MKNNIQNNLINNKSAFTIIETLVTLLAISIMIAGPLTFMARSYSYATIIRAKVIETGLSQEGIELATSLRNDNLNNFQTTVNACSSGCMVDWNGISSKPTFLPCSAETCRLFKSSSDTNTYYKTLGDIPTDYYRYVKFTANAADSYTVESVTYTYLNDIKVEVNLKKIIYNITIK